MRPGHLACHRIPCSCTFCTHDAPFSLLSWRSAVHYQPGSSAVLLSRRRLTAACPADAKGMSGISDPFPNMFDPANLLGNAGSSNSGTSEVKRWRESELTHGRVAMLAALGFVVQEQIQDYPNTPFPHVEGEFTASADKSLCKQTPTN